MMKWLKQLVLKSFDIRDGEFIPAFLLQLNIFLVILTYITLKPTVNSLFLSKFGVNQLPYAFILLAFFAAIVSVFYSRALIKIALNKMIRFTNITGVLFLLIFGILLHFKIAEGIVLYAFYIWLAIFAVLATSQFWMLANIVFSIREAKRLFSFIGAGAIFGGVTGGYIASFLATFFNSNSIIFVALLFLLASIPVSNSLWKNYVAKKLTTFQKKKRLTGFAANPFNIVKNSRYLSLIAGIVGLGVVVSKLVDYQFSDIVTSQIHDPDELTSFFGFWFSTFNLISLIVQLFITRHIIGKYGVGTSLLVLPLAIFSGAFLLLFLPVLWVVIFIQLSDFSLKNSLNRSAIELLSLPIPMDIKARVKTFIDVFVDKGATGIAGLLLIFVIKGLHLPSIYVTIMILILIIGWVYIAFQIRLEYLKSFQLKLLAKADKNGKKFDLKNTSIINSIIKVLEKGNDKQVLYMLNKVYEFTDKRFFNSIQSLLKHKSELIRVAALKNIYLYKSPLLIEEVMNMVNDPSSEVKIHAMEYLIAHATDNRISLIKSFIESDDYKLNGSALITLAMQSRNNLEIRKLFKLEDRIKEKIDYLNIIDDIEINKYYRISILRSIGHANIEKFFPFIEANFIHEDIEIVKEAITAAGDTLNPFFIEKLYELLLQNDLLKTTSKALSNYGREIITSFYDIADDKERSINLIRKLPFVCEKIGLAVSVEFLFSLLRFEDTTVRLQAIRSLTELKIKYPFLAINKKEVFQLINIEANSYIKTLTVLYAQSSIDNNIETDNIIDARKSLIKILEKRLDSILERIFRLLGLKYPPEQILSIYENINTTNLDFRANALELLDNILEVDLKKILMPIIEIAIMHEIPSKAVEIMEIEYPDDYQCFTMLMKGPDVKVKMAVLFLIEQIGDKKFLPLVVEHLNSNNIKVKSFAIKANEKLIN